MRLLKRSTAGTPCKWRKSCAPAPSLWTSCSRRKNGHQVLAELKADPETWDIPVVIVSITQEQPSAFRLGAADYLEKPVDRERLLEVVRCAQGSRCTSGASAGAGEG